jgi:hypothetical protein
MTLRCGRFLAVSRWPVQLSFTMILRFGPEQCMLFHPGELWGPAIKGDAAQARTRAG